jgi:two-component system, NtrC family, nitrogen regulation response regulator GlnG
MDSEKRTILVADDEASVRWVLAKALEESGHKVVQAESGVEALHCMRTQHIDAAFIDLRMPGHTGLEVLTEARASSIEAPIIIVTAQDTMDNAIEAMKQGAFDYVTKPFNIEEVRAIAARALDMVRMSADLSRLQRETRKRYEPGVALIGSSQAMREIYKTIGRVADTDATVLIQGESGTGKDLIAKVLHYHSSRWSSPFVALNCSAIPRDLLESELFGYERGAFTGALEQRAGKFEQADGGTLLLDEIGDMPLELQTKLLRVLQEREVTRLGGNQVIPVTCRVLAATNQPLDRAVQQGRFREDLYFRLNVVPIRVPPLRERRSDIEDLIDFFLEKMNAEMGTRVSAISPDARAKLVAHDWPGNVRELENTLIRSAVLAAGPTLLPQDLLLSSEPTAAVQQGDGTLEDLIRRKLGELFRRGGGAIEEGDLYANLLEHLERPLIELTLEKTGGNQLQAAALLGINRNTLRKKISALGIDPRRILGGRNGD